jgi:hypothetical protein
MNKNKNSADFKNISSKSSSQITQSNLKKEEVEFSGVDIKTMVDRFKNLHDQIDRKLDELFQKTGWNPRYIKDYLENPNNFSSQEWERVQKERQSLLTHLYKGLGKNVEEIQKIEKIKAREKASKDRKGKTLGARKNWIPMR